MRSRQRSDFTDIIGGRDLDDVQEVYYESDPDSVDDDALRSVDAFSSEDEGDERFKTGWIYSNEGTDLLESCFEAR